MQWNRSECSTVNAFFQIVTKSKHHAVRNSIFVAAGEFYSVSGKCGYSTDKKLDPIVWIDKYYDIPFFRGDSPSRRLRSSAICLRSVISLAIPVVPITSPLSS